VPRARDLVVVVEGVVIADENVIHYGRRPVRRWIEQADTAGSLVVVLFGFRQLFITIHLYRHSGGVTYIARHAEVYGFGRLAEVLIEVVGSQLHGLARRASARGEGKFHCQATHTEITHQVSQIGFGTEEGDIGPNRNVTPLQYCG